MQTAQTFVSQGVLNLVEIEKPGNKIFKDFDSLMLDEQLGYNNTRI